MAIIKLEDKQKIIKNFVAINVSFVLVFSAVNCTNSIQPIINRNQSLGTISQSIIYAVQILTSLVLPQVICEIIGFKFALALGELLHLTYILAQISPSWYTFIPTSVLAGIGNSLCWTILGIYLTLCSKLYSKQKNMSFIRVQTLFFGISTSIFLTSNIIAQSLVAILLKTEGDELVSSSPSTTSASQNLTTVLHSFTSVSSNDNSNQEINADDFDYANSCGKNNCPDTALPGSLSNITRSSFISLYISLIVLIVASMFVTIFFMDNIKERDESSEENEMESAEERNKNGAKSKSEDKLTLSVIGSRFKNELVSLMKLCLNIDVWLLFPLTIYTGFELTFIWFEFNNAFATCLLGVNYVGYANILFGALGSILCLIMGYVLKYIGTMTGIIFMLMVAVCQNIFILSWTPVNGEVITVFLVIASFALSQSVSNGQVRGLYGVYFPNNGAAFSAATVSQTTGLFLGSLVSAYCCVYIKSYIYIGVVLSALICYIILAVKHAKRKLVETDKEKLLNTSSTEASFDEISNDSIAKEKQHMKF